jgi:hypothetical protein
MYGNEDTSLYNRLLQEYAIYMHWEGMESLGLSLASKLGLHPVILEAGLANFSNSFPK